MGPPKWGRVGNEDLANLNISGTAEASPQARRMQVGRRMLQAEQLAGRVVLGGKTGLAFSSPEHLLEDGSGSLFIARQLGGNSQIQAGLFETRLENQSLSEKRDGFLGPLELDQQGTESVPGVDQGGSQFQSAAIFGFGSFQSTRAPQQIAQVGMGNGVTRIQLQNAPQVVGRNFGPTHLKFGEG